VTVDGVQAPAPAASQSWRDHRLLQPWWWTRHQLLRLRFLARKALYYTPLSPTCRPTIDVARDTGLGDVVMCTPALRALKRAHPDSRIRFYTKFPGLVQGLPYIDEVHPFEARPASAIFAEYTEIMPWSTHIATIIGDRLGVRVEDTRPDCVVDERLVARYRDAWRGLPRPWVLVLQRASRFTPNKDWPAASWRDLVRRLCRSGTVIEIGNRYDDEGDRPEGSYLDLRDQTSLAELVAAVAAGDIYLGPVSGPMHIAAAVHTPSVVVIGGYEHPINSRYPGNAEFYTAVPCAPCWLRTPCPFDLKCLRAIASAQVEQAVGRTWDRLRAEQANPPGANPPGANPPGANPPGASFSGTKSA
jgi:ADP-heptose:LPS heptosyltransferase